MHTTETRTKIKTLKKMAQKEIKIAQQLKDLDYSEAQYLAIKLEKTAHEKLEMAEKLKDQARLEDLSVYKVNMKKVVRKGVIKTYTYWHASWREGKQVKTVYLGSTKQMCHDEALAKARKLKAESLGIVLNDTFRTNL